MNAATLDVTLPDGSVRTLPAGSTGLDLAQSIGSRLAKAALAAVVNGNEVDISVPLSDGAQVAIITADSEAGRHVLRHSTAHVLALAVLQHFLEPNSPLVQPLKTVFITTLNFQITKHSATTTLKQSLSACAQLSRLTNHLFAPK